MQVTTGTHLKNALRYHAKSNIVMASILWITFYEI